MLWGLIVVFAWRKKWCRDVRDGCARNFHPPRVLNVLDNQGLPINLSADKLSDPAKHVP